MRRVRKRSISVFSMVVPPTTANTTFELNTPGAPRHTGCAGSGRFSSASRRRRSASLRSSALVPAKKIGIEKSTRARRSSVGVSVPQLRSTRPCCTASKRFAGVTGTKSTARAGSFNSAFTASATFWHSATEKPAGLPPSLKAKGRVSVR